MKIDFRIQKYFNEKILFQSLVSNSLFKICYYCSSMSLQFKQLNKITHLIIQCFIRCNKMFDHLLDRDERLIRQQKCKLYKQMLDNQIILNEQYRRKLEEKQPTTIRSQQYKKKNKVNDKRTHSQQSRVKTKLKDQKKQQNLLRLPSLIDRNFLLKDSNNVFKSLDSPKLTRVKKSRAIYIQQKSSESQDEDEDIEDIISQLKCLNKEMIKSKLRLKSKRLSNIGAVSRRNRPKYQRQQSEQMKNYAINEKVKKSLEYNESERQASLVVSLSRSPHYNDSKQASTFRTANKAERQISIDRTSTNSPKNQQSNENDRNKFLQLLKKIKNRGQSLFVKLSKYPIENNSQLKAT